MSERTSDPSSKPEGDSPDKNEVSGVLFPKLSAEQYKAGVFRYLYILMRVVFMGLVAAGLWWVADALGTLFFPLVASLVLAYLLDPAIDNLEERGLGRSPAIALCLLGVVALIALAGFFLVPFLVAQTTDMISQVPRFVRTVQLEWLPWLEERLQTELPASMRDAVRRYGNELTARLPEMLEGAGRWILGAVSTTGQVVATLFNMVLIPLFTFYFLREFGGLKHWLGRWMPVRRREFTLKLLARMDGAIGDWFRGQIQVAMIMGALFAVGLAIIFGLGGIDPTLGVAVGIISGLLNIVPYFGMVVAIVLTTLVVLLNWPGFAIIIAVVALFILNSLLESYVVTPRVVGQKVGLSPIAVILLLLIGGALAGIWGILLVVPIAGAIKVILPDLLAIYRESTFYQGGIATADEVEGEQ